MESMGDGQPTHNLKKTALGKMSMPGVYNVFHLTVKLPDRKAKTLLEAAWDHKVEPDSAMRNLQDYLGAIDHLPVGHRDHLLGLPKRLSVWDKKNTGLCAAGVEGEIRRILDQCRLFCVLHRYNKTVRDTPTYMKSTLYPSH